MKINKVSQMKTYEQRWTRSCLRAMTPLPAVSLSSCIIWPVIQNIRNCVGRRLCKSWMARTPWIGRLLFWRYHHEMSVPQFADSMTLTASFCLIPREDLSKIPYTTMCIKESLRLHPPVPGMSRKTVKPITFFDGRTLPAGLLWFIAYVLNPTRLKITCAIVFI